MVSATRTRVVMADHTLVRPSPLPSALCPFQEETVQSVYQLLSSVDRPLPLMELAARLSLPRAVVATAVTALTRDYLVQLSPNSIPSSLLTQVRSPHQAPTRPIRPGMSSAKITVVGGSHGAGATTYVETVSERPLVRVTETFYTPSGDLVSTSLELGAIPVDPAQRLHLLSTPPVGTFDALWPDVVRGAVGIIVMVHPHHVSQAAPTVVAAQDTGLPLHVVINHLDDTDPDPRLAASTLGVAPNQVTRIDARSAPAARSVLHQLLHRVEDAS